MTAQQVIGIVFLACGVVGLTIEAYLFLLSRRDLIDLNGSGGVLILLVEKIDRSVLRGLLFILVSALGVVAFFVAEPVLLVQLLLGLGVIGPIVMLIMSIVFLVGDQRIRHQGS